MTSSVEIRMGGLSWPSDVETVDLQELFDKEEDVSNNWYSTEPNIFNTTNGLTIDNNENGSAMQEFNTNFVIPQALHAENTEALAATSTNTQSDANIPIEMHIDENNTGNASSITEQEDQTKLFRPPGKKPLPFTAMICDKGHSHHLRAEKCK